MKLAFFVAEFPVLSETFVIRQVAGMVRAGHEVTVIAGQWGDRELTHGLYNQCGLQDRVVTIREGGRWRQLLAIGRMLANALRSRAAMRDLGVAIRATLGGSPGSLVDIASMGGREPFGRFDAIVAHFGPAGVRAMHLQRCGLLQGPLATVFHGFDVSDRRTIRRYRKLYRELIDHCAQLLPISHLWQRRLVEWGASPDRTRVLRMGVDVDQLAMLDPARPVGRPLRVLSVARFTEKKGLRYAIEGVLACRSPVHYEIIGAGPEAQRLEALAAKAGSDKRIRFLGRKRQAEVFDALSAADVFLLPSVTAAGGDMEGVPVALMEAMAKGVLVLATRHSGIPELIDDGRNGFLVDERDATAIARVLDALPEAPHESLRRRARQRIEGEFDNRALDRQLTDLVQDMAGRSLHVAQGERCAGSLGLDHP